VANVYSQGINQRLAHELAHTGGGTCEARTDGDVDVRIARRVLLLVRPRERLGEREDEKGRNSGSGIDDFVQPEGDGLMAGSLPGAKGPRVITRRRLRPRAARPRRLRKEVGDTRLHDLQELLEELRLEAGRTKDFIGLTNFITKKDWNPWSRRT